MPAGLLAALAAFVVVSTANGGMYRYGVSDQAFYIPVWGSFTLERPGLDLAATPPSAELGSRAAILEFFEGNAAGARKLLVGKTDAEALIAAAKGMAWESPRGPMSIDPETRDVIQTVYIRRVERVGGQLVNVEFDKIENVKDPVKARSTN